MEFIKSLKHNQMLLGRVTALYPRASWNSPYHQGIWLRQDYGQYHGNRMPHQPPASLSVPWAVLTFASGFARHAAQVRASGKLASCCSETFLFWPVQNNMAGHHADTTILVLKTCYQCGCLLSESLHTSFFFFFCDSIRRLMFEGGNWLPMHPQIPFIPFRYPGEDSEATGYFANHQHCNFFCGQRLALARTHYLIQRNSFLSPCMQSMLAQQHNLTPCRRRILCSEEFRCT